MTHLILWMVLGLAVGSLLMGVVLTTVDEVREIVAYKREKKKAAQPR